MRIAAKEERLAIARNIILCDVTYATEVSNIFLVTRLSVVLKDPSLSDDLTCLPVYL